MWSCPCLLTKNLRVASFLLSVLCKQEIMVGSMFQAEIPAGTCKYKENEKGEICLLLLFGINI